MSRRNRAFTLIELLVVIFIIAVLTGLSFSIYGSVQESGKRKTAAAEIRLFDLKLNDFNLDNGFLPQATFIGGKPPVSAAELGDYDADPADEAYFKSARVLFLALTGRTSYADSESDETSYLEPRPASVGAPNESGEGSGRGRVYVDPTSRKTYENHSFDSGSYFIDPWGNPYGFYYDPENGDWKSFRTPSTYDIWSTGKSTESKPESRSKWITSWDDSGG